MLFSKKRDGAIWTVTQFTKTDFFMKLNKTIIYQFI